MARSVKVNYALNLTNIVLGIVFPLITFPYVTRILSPGGIGQVQFYSSIIEYVTLFTALGIPLYAVREIAKVRDDKNKRNKLTAEILTLHLLLSAVGYVAVAVLAFVVPHIHENVPLFLILSLSIILNTIGTSWFFQAVEDFTYITIRSLFVRIISLVLLFIMVRDANDIIPYGIVLTCGSAGNNIFNFIRLKKYVSFEDFHQRLEPFIHVLPTLKIFLLNVTIGIYTQLSVVLLGFLQSNDAVGYYAMPQKIVTVILTMVTALSGVLLPRLSNYLGNNNAEQFKQLGNKAISFVLALTLPIAVGLVLLSKPMTILLFSETYIQSYPVLVIWAPIIAIIGLSQVYGKSILYSTGHELLMTLCTVLGMLVYLGVGFPAIMKYSIYGAAAASFFAEVTVTLSMMILGKKYHPCTIFRKENLTYVLAALIMAIPVYFCTLIKANIWQLIIGIPVGAITYLLILIIKKDSFSAEIINSIKSNKFLNR